MPRDPLAPVSTREMRTEFACARALLDELESHHWADIEDAARDAAVAHAANQLFQLAHTLKHTTAPRGAAREGTSPQEHPRSLIMTNVTAATQFSIVVGLDLREAGGYAFGQAALVARAIPGSTIHLVHVCEGPLDSVRRTQLMGQLRLYVNEKAASLGGLAGVRVGIHLRVGNIVRELVQLASDVSSNMIVIGAVEGPQLENWLVGSVAQRLLLAAPCPVLVAGPQPPPVHHQPKIEPPCADCERTRAASGRATWWCERHSHHAARAHVFSYQRELPLETHDSEVIPTGIAF